MRRIPAFTLVELLVTIAIAGLLAALFLPALGRSRERIHAAVCLGNLRQWGTATHLYAADHEDYLPPEGVPNPGLASTNTGWYVQLPRQLGLPPYHESRWHTNPAANPGRVLWICPANPRRSNGLNLFHYCLNEHVNGTGDAQRAVKLSSVANPALVVWLFDTKNLPAVGYWAYVHTNLHRHGAQFAFLDAHARRFPNTEYWDFAVNRGRPWTPNLQWIP
jgi:prepilin-type N-terminal cleavage/methylation domain-containing protein